MSPARAPRWRHRARPVRIAGLLLLGVSSLKALRAAFGGSFAFVSGGALAARLGCVARRAGDDGSQGVAMYEAAMTEEAESLARRISVEDLEPGQELTGVVNGIAPFGAFVDVGADRDGLIHISKISTGFVDDVRNFLQAGETVKVRVLSVREDRVDLTMLKAEDEASSPSPDVSFFETISPSEWMDATVDGIMDFGLFVTVPPPGGGTPAKGMVHISKIKVGFVEHPSNEVEPGQVVRVRVESVDANGKLQLSMKELDAEPVQKETQDVSAFSGVGENEWLVGKVDHTRHFGVFVDLPHPSGEGTVRGMVHVTQIREGFVDDPALEVTVGQDVRVRVIEVDTDQGRIGLSMKEPLSPLEE